MVIAVRDYFTKGTATGGQEYDTDKLVVNDDGSPKIYTSEDQCAQGKVYENYCTAKGAVKQEWVACPNGCEDGACIGEVDINTENYTIGDEENEINEVNEINEGENYSSQNISSEVDTGCPSLGYRKSGEYCSEAGDYLLQKTGDEDCENDFECISNSCIDSQCVESGFWSKIFSWFRRLL